MTQFSPIIKLSNNVPSTLSEVAKDRDLNISEIDFDLIGMQTLIQSPEYKEFTIIEEPIERIFDEEMLRSDKLIIKQDYKLNIRPYHQDDEYKNIKMEISDNVKNFL